MNDFHFLRPWFLLALPLAGLFYYWLRAQFNQQNAWQRIIDPRLLPHLLEADAAQQGVRFTLPLLVVAWLIACLAAAGPSWQKIEQPISQQENALVIILDLSLSMYAEDEKPSRLIRAKRKITDLLQQRKEGVTALISYSGDAHLVVPLTEDGQTIQNLLPALEPSIMPKFGSNLSAALKLAQQQIEQAANQHTRVLLLTDEISEKDFAAMPRLLNKPDQLSIITFGTPDGAPIPIPQQGFLKDQRGTTVFASLNDQAIKQWANQHGINVQHNRLDNRDIQALAHFDAELKENQQNQQSVFWQDNGHWLVLLLLPIALYGFRRGVIL